jgi:hypothetical protein
MFQFPYIATKSIFSLRVLPYFDASWDIDFRQSDIQKHRFDQLENWACYCGMGYFQETLTASAVPDCIVTVWSGDMGDKSVGRHG